MKKEFVRCFETDASMVAGNASDVIIPENIEEVRREIVRCQRVVLRGGGTGLAGGAVPLNGDVVFDLSKLTKISNLDIERKIVEVEAGVVLDDLQNYLSNFGLEFPVNPSSHGVCTLGGMIATDAVGSRAIKYGKTSNWIRWIDVVDGDGKIDRKGVTELTDYAGLEGITGIIVRACLNLVAQVKRSASLISSNDISKVISIVKDLRRDLSVSMIEFIDKKISRGLGLEEKYHLIVEYESGAGLLHGVEYEKLLVLRDKVYPLIASEGYTRIEDPKILVDRFSELLSWLEFRQIPVFGHLSVGILHPCFNKEQEKYIPEMVQLVKRIGGQVSGEHGIGFLKKEFIEAGDKKIWVNIKKRTDPRNKFNVGKVL